MRLASLLLLTVLNGCSASAQQPTPKDLSLAASASAGVFEATDEVCIGDGDISASLERAVKSGWTKFEPHEGTMLSKVRDIYLDDSLTSLEVIMLRKNENRASILLAQDSSYLSNRYMRFCDVYDENAKYLDEAALQKWAAVPLKPTMSANSFDIEGGRFSGKQKNLTTVAFYEQPEGRSPVKGLVLKSLRTNSVPEGN
jgi:hypothetical protein